MSLHPSGGREQLPFCQSAARRSLKRVSASPALTRICLMRAKSIILPAFAVLCQGETGGDTGKAGPQALSPALKFTSHGEVVISLKTCDL